MGRRRNDGGTTAVLDRPGDEPVEAVAPRRRGVLSSVWVLLVIAIAAGLLLLLVFPTRAWLSQRSAIDGNERKLELLQAENERLEDKVDGLSTPEEIERVARAQYNLVKPGERPFAVLPEPAAAPLPDEWPYGLIKQMIAARGGADVVADPTAPAPPTPGSSAAPG
jgi:cell division protein FtsB